MARKWSELSDRERKAVVEHNCKQQPYTTDEEFAKIVESWISLVSTGPYYFEDLEPYVFIPTGDVKVKKVLKFKV